MSTIKCPQCNLVNWASDHVCKRCGLAFAPPVDPGPEHFEYITPAENPVQQFTPQAADSPTFSTSAETARTVISSGVPRYEYQQGSLKKKIGLAVFSMIAGVIGVPPLSSFIALAVGAVLGLIFGAGGFIAGIVLVLAFIPAGLITGIISLRRAGKRPDEFGGKGFAIAGVVCSSLGLVVIPVIAAIAIPNLLASRRAANEGNAISSIRKIASAQDIVSREYSKGQCGDLAELVGMGIIDPTMEKGEKSGYRFTIVKYPAGGCEIHATPISASMGTRSFFVSTNDGIVRAAARKGLQADKNDPPIPEPFSKKDELPAKIALKNSR